MQLAQNCIAMKQTLVAVAILFGRGAFLQWFLATGSSWEEACGIPDPKSGSD